MTDSDDAAVKAFEHSLLDAIESSSLPPGLRVLAVVVADSAVELMLARRGAREATLALNAALTAEFEQACGAYATRAEGLASVVRHLAQSWRDNPITVASLPPLNDALSALTALHRQFVQARSQIAARLEREPKDDLRVRARVEAGRRFLEAMRVLEEAVSQENAAALASSGCDGAGPYAIPRKLEYAGVEAQSIAEDGEQPPFAPLENAVDPTRERDTCGMCRRALQDGTKYGAGVPRIHCLDCPDGRNALCLPCNGVTEAFVAALEVLEERARESDAALPFSLDDALAGIRRVVRVINFHAFHVHSGVEHSTTELMRMTMRDEPPHRTLAMRIVGHFRRWAARPFFGFVAAEYRAPRELIDPEVAAAMDPWAAALCAADLPAPLGVRWASYAQIFAVVRRVASELLVPGGGDDEPPAVGIAAVDNSLFYCGEISCFVTQRCAAGCYGLWPVQDIAAAWALAGATVALVDAEVLARLAGLPPSVRRVIVLRWDEAAVPSRRQQFCALAATQSAAAALAARTGVPVDVLVLDPFLAAPDEAEPRAFDVPDACDRAFRALTIFTSGSSGGSPKAIVMTPDEFIRDTFLSYFHPNCGVSKYAASWATDKRNVHSKLHNGGRVAFAPRGSDPSETLRVTRPQPTNGFVPVVAESFFRRFEAAAQRFAPAVADRLLRPDPVAVRTLAEALAAFHVYQHGIGGEAVVMTIGGAKVRPALLQWLRDAMPAEVVENCGITEAGSVLKNGRPSEGVTLKLVDRPDLGYTTRDRPYPRGEIAIKSPDVQRRDGWLADAAAAADIAARYIDGGFFLTRDIARLLPDGRLEIIDRASAVVKLPNGKFMAPERTEMVVAEALGAAAEFVFVDVEPGAEEGTAAVVALVRAPAVVAEGERAALVERVAAALAAGGVPADEAPSIVVFDDAAEPPSKENGCLTPSNKVFRLGVRQRRLAPALRAGAQRFVVGSRAVPAAADGGSGEVDGELDAGRLAVHIAHSLVPRFAGDSTAAATSTFADLGCDSLALLRIPIVLPTVLASFSARFRADPLLARVVAGGLSTPRLHAMTPLALAQLALDVANNTKQHSLPPHLPATADAVAEGEADAAPMAAAATAEAPGAAGPDWMIVASAPESELHEARVTARRLAELERTLLAQADALSALRRVHELGRPAAGVARTCDDGLSVVLTGATGYLGRFLLATLLQSPRVRRVVCLARARDGADALARLRSACLHGTELDNLDDAAFASLFDSKVVAVDADLAQPNLGFVTPDAYAAAARAIGADVDLVVHNAAVIKSWPAGGGGLDRLLPPNVDGTLRLLRLAAIDAPALAPAGAALPAPAIVYVSTSSVCGARDVTAADGSLQGAWPTTGTASALGNRAYALSKLLAENVTRAFCARAGLPFAVVRPPLLTWAASSGFGNEDDWLNRLLVTCVATRMAPVFQRSEDWHVTQLAVDTCAARIVDHAFERFFASGGAKEAPHERAIVFYPADRATDHFRVADVVQEVRDIARDSARARTAGGGDEKVELVGVPAWCWVAGLRLAATRGQLFPYSPLVVQGGGGFRATAAAGAAVAERVEVGPSLSIRWKVPLRRFVETQLFLQR